MVKAASVEVVFFNDHWKVEQRQERTVEQVSPELASLFGYAHQWAAEEKRDDGCDLTFSAMLAAMVKHDQPLCKWLRDHLERRGADDEKITKGRSFSSQQLYPTRDTGDQFLATTSSFRTAFEMARELRGLTDPDAPIDVRHFMAGYAVCRNYHLADFRRFNIDRWEWCVELSKELVARYPVERRGWEAYASMATPLPPLAFHTDAPEGRDLMHLGREVEAFARLIAARSTTTPLSIGVFGAWGSGKSFFMRRVRERVASLAAEPSGGGGPAQYHGQIAQVEFNAWHYSEDALIPSLVSHIFHNLRIKAEDELDATLRRRSAEVMSLLDRAKQGLSAGEHDVAEAEARQAEAEAELARIDEGLPGELAEKQRELDRATAAQLEAQADLDRAIAERDAAIARAVRKTRALAVVGALRDDVPESELDQASTELVEMADRARKLATRGRLILLGLGVLAVGAMVATIVLTGIYAKLVAIATAVTAYVAIAQPWLTKLKDAVKEIATRGKRFQEERARIARAVTEKVTAAHAAGIAEREEKVNAQTAAIEEARTQLAAVAEKSAEGRRLLEERQQERAAAEERRTQAIQDVHARTAELERVSISTLLGEFLDEQAAADSYRTHLTVLTRVRNDFERLSKLIARATEDHYKHDKPPPPVSRIVLYIDDLDRCPEAKVKEVLRAVHLLLAFPLFVCVVAVDPRWLTTCLIQADGLKVDRSLPEAGLGKPPSPADYIEKIFQVPLWLRPVPQDRRSALARALLDAFDPPSSATEATITEEELDFLHVLAPVLDGKPRTLKRFANMYRLVKTALSDVELRIFSRGIRTSNRPDRYYLPHPICMTQLAVLCADRDRARALVDHVDGSEATTVAAWLAELAAVQPALARLFETALGAVQRAPGDLPLASLDELDFSVFRLWLERTRRYSFYL